MKRFKERLDDLEKAIQRLEEALQEETTDLVIDGVLHRFEFTFELAWKTVKDYLEYQGISQKIGSPREVIKEAFSVGIIESGDIWIEMMLSRNSLSHLYDEGISREIYNQIKELYFKEIKNLENKLKK